MTEGLRKQIERANKLMQDKPRKPKMTILKCNRGAIGKSDRKFDLKEFNKHLLNN